MQLGLDDIKIGATYLAKGAALDSAGAVERDDEGSASAVPDADAFVEPPLFKTLLALRMNLEKPCGFSPGGPDPPGTEELIVIDFKSLGFSYGEFEMIDRDVNCCLFRSNINDQWLCMG